MRLLTLLMLLGLMAGPAGAAPLTNQDRQDIARVEDYLNARHNMSAKFIQTVDNGDTVTGTVLIKRPGKMNLSYDPPLKDYIIADGSFVYLWDGELHHATTVPMGDSLADLILRAHLKLSGDIEVTHVERSPSTLEVSVRQTKDPDNGTLTLLFEDNPFILHGWRVQDAQNRVTTVALQNMREDMELPDRTFTFVPPDLGKSAHASKLINE